METQDSYSPSDVSSICAVSDISVIGQELLLKKSKLFTAYYCK
jgi:hypothetical protein